MVTTPAGGPGAGEDQAGRAEADPKASTAKVGRADPGASTARVEGEVEARVLRRRKVERAEVEVEKRRETRVDQRREENQF